MSTAVLAIYNIYIRRQRQLTMMSSDSSLSRDQFIRLNFVTVMELGACTIRAIFNLTSYMNSDTQSGLPGSTKPVNLSDIGVIPRVKMTSFALWNLQLQWYTVTVCSLIFFLCFATGSETTKFYRRALRKVFPCIPADNEERSKFNTTTSGTS